MPTFGKLSIIGDPSETPGMQSLNNKILVPDFHQNSGGWGYGEEGLLGFERSPFPMCIIDEETLAFLAVNDAAAVHYGYSREEFLSLTLQQLRPDEKPELLFAELESVKNSTYGIWYSRITRHCKKDRTPIDVQVTRSRIIFVGRPAMLCSLEDVTERMGHISGETASRIEQNARVQQRAAELWAATLELKLEIAERKRLERRNLAFLKLGQSLSTATTAYDAAKIISEIALQLFGWDAYTLDLFSAETSETVPILYIDSFNGHRKEVAVHQSREKLAQRALRIIGNGGELVLNEVKPGVPSEEVFFGDMSRSCASMMFVPIQSRGKPIGTLSVQSYRENVYTKEDLQTLHALADHCAGALERISAEQTLRKFEERNTTLLTTSNLRLQFEINRRFRLEKRNESLSKLGRSLSVARTAREAALTVTTAADELIGWDCCNLQLYSADKKVVRVLNIDCINGERCEVAPDKSTQLTPILRKVLEEGPQLVLRKEPITFSNQTVPFGDVRRPSASLMFVPIRQGEVVKGFFSIQSYTVNAYTEDDLQTLLVLSDHCVGALERIWMENALLQSESQKNAMLSAANTKLQREITERHRLEKELLETADHERRRIGQDLHDDVGQQLTGINLLSQGLALHLAKKKLRKEAAEASRIRRLTAQTLQRARALAHGLANFQFNENDLVASLENLADRTRKSFKTSCRVEVEGRVVQLHEQVVRQIYSITQEAVTNAIKHGRAKHIRLQITFSSSRMVLVAKNDGRRFVERENASPGMGLRIMQYRASVIGATLQLRPNGTRGTVLTCSLPLKTARKLKKKK